MSADRPTLRHLRTLAGRGWDLDTGLAGNPLIVIAETTSNRRLLWHGDPRCVTSSSSTSEARLVPRILSAAELLATAEDDERLCACEVMCELGPLDAWDTWSVGEQMCAVFDTMAWVSKPRRPSSEDQIQRLGAYKVLHAQVTDQRLAARAGEVFADSPALLASLAQALGEVAAGAREQLGEAEALADAVLRLAVWLNRQQRSIRRLLAMEVDPNVDPALAATLGVLRQVQADTGADSDTPEGRDVLLAAAAGKLVHSRQLLAVTLPRNALDRAFEGDVSWKLRELIARGQVDRVWLPSQFVREVLLVALPTLVALEPARENGPSWGRPQAGHLVGTVTVAKLGTLEPTDGRELFDVAHQLYCDHVANSALDADPKTDPLGWIVGTARALLDASSTGPAGDRARELAAAS